MSDENLLQYLDRDGNVVDDTFDIDDAFVVEMYRLMVRTRAFDERALVLQRTGRIPAFYQCSGQEAHVAAALALEPDDWILLQYREQGIRAARGISVGEELAMWKGRIDLTWDPLQYHVSPMTATIGSHLPHATGIGYANRLLDSEDVVMAVFGDGGTSESDFHAALNAAGVWKTATVFFCQNNEYAASTPYRNQTAAETIADKAAAYGMPGVRVDGMDPIAVYQATRTAVERARTGEGPTLIEAWMYRFGAHSTYAASDRYRTPEEEAEGAKRDPLIRTGNYLRSKGLIDDGFEDAIIEEIKAAVDDAIDEIDASPIPPRDVAPRSLMTGVPARLADQITANAEIDGGPAVVFDAEDVFTAETEVPPGGPVASMTMVEALNRTIDEAMSQDPRVLVLGEDVGPEGGVFRVTEGLFDTYGRDRVLDTPLNELTIVGSAVGMAIAGLRPICDIQFATFENVAFDQTVFHVARYRWRTGGRIAMPIVIRLPAGGGHQGFEGHSSSPEALFVQAPGLHVVYPSNAYDARGLMASAIASDDPVVFFEPIAQYFTRSDGVPTEPYTIPIGTAKIVRPGNDVTVLAYGNMVHTAGRAAEQLAEAGISAEIVDLRTLKPLDEDTIVDSVARTGRLVVVHEAPLTGGFGGELVATVVEKAGDFLEAPPARVAHPDIMWNPALLESHSIIGPQRVVAAVRKVMEE